jgi:hypothetical protein
MTHWDDLKPTKVGLCGDWHTNQHFAKRAIEYAKDNGAEVILHVGDFAFRFDNRFMRNVQDALQRTGLVLGFVDGNHDDHAMLGGLVDVHGVTAIPMRPNIFYLPRTYRWTWNDVRFLALGGAHSVDRPWRTPGVEWWPDETISWQEAQRACDDGPCDVMITHDVPAGVRIPCIESNPCGFPEAEIYAAEQHRQLLRQVVDQVTPSRIFAGHYHCRLTGGLRGNGYRTVVDILNGDSGPISENTIVLELPAPNAM